MNNEMMFDKNIVFAHLKLHLSVSITTTMGDYDVNVSAIHAKK